MSKIYNSNGGTNASSDIQNTTSTETAKNIYVPDYIDTIFQRLHTQDVEQFYKSYHLWSLQQRMKTLQVEIDAIQQAITDNDALMQQVQPSAIALASLAQLQASGVSNLDLLDKMLARGDIWLDHTMQLLEQCEKLDVIRGNYTQWCEHALEGAYEWIFSIHSKEKPAEAARPTVTEPQELQAPTEAQLLQKLMSDEEMTAKIPVSGSQFDEFEAETLASVLPIRKITQPLAQLELDDSDVSPTNKKITQPLAQPEQERTEARKITRPLETGVGASPDVRPGPDDLGSGEPEHTPDDAPTQANTIIPANSTAPTIGDMITTEEPEPASEQIEEPTDVAIRPEEETGASSRQEETEKNDVIVISKDADIQELDVTEVRIPSIVATAQIKVGSLELVSLSQKNKMPQAQKARQRGFWHWLRRLVAAILRR